jgi:hypothetical protein
MDVFARRLPYLIAWLQQALAVTERTACGIGACPAPVTEIPRGPNGEPPPFESFPSLNHAWEDEDDDEEPDDAEPDIDEADTRQRERDADDGLTYADPRDEREARRNA